MSYRCVNGADECTGCELCAVKKIDEDDFCDDCGNLTNKRYETELGWMCESCYLKFLERE